LPKKNSLSLTIQGKFLAIAKSVFRDEINTDGSFRFYANKPEVFDVQIISRRFWRILIIRSRGGTFGELAF